MNGEKGIFIGENPSVAFGKALPFRSGKGQKGRALRNNIETQYYFKENG
jgi:hypothetical protein